MSDMYVIYDELSDCLLETDLYSAEEALEALKNEEDFLKDWWGRDNSYCNIRLREDIGVLEYCTITVHNDPDQTHELIPHYYKIIKLADDINHTFQKGYTYDTIEGGKNDI